MKNKKLFVITILVISLTLIVAGCENSSPTSSIDNTYSISGQVQNPSNEGIENVKINVVDSTKTATTDKEGKWTLSNLKGEVTIKPVKENYIFDPNQKTLEKGKSGVNFTAQHYNSDYKIGMVTDSNGLPDYNNFNTLAYKSLQKINDKYGVDIKVIESTSSSDYVSNLNILAEQGYDLIWAVGFKMGEAVKTAADNNPDTDFGLLDGSITEKSNVFSSVFDPEKGSFLAGVAAGEKTETNKIGFIGGFDFVDIQLFEAGFKAGAYDTKPDCKILTDYVGSFNDPRTAKDQAKTMYNNGVDIIYHAAGNSGTGVIEAAKEPGNYAIGVDKPQYNLAPDHVLTSMVKKSGNILFNETENFLTDNFQTGTKKYGLHNDGLGLYRPQAEEMLSKDTIDLIDEYKQKIISNSITVPEDPHIFGTITGAITENLDNNLRAASGLVTLEGNNTYKIYGDANWGNDGITGGSFYKEGIKASSYTLTVNKLGYEKVTKNITINKEQTTDLGNIEMPLKSNFTSDGIIYYATNPNKAPFDDKSVRRALTYGIDWSAYESFLDIPNTQAKKLANRIMTPNTTGYIEEKITNNYDLAKAENILNQAGYTNGQLDLTISVSKSISDFENIARELKTYWERIDQINTVTIKSYSWDTFTSKVFNNEVGLYILGWNIDNPDPVFLLDYFVNHHLDNDVGEELIQKAKMNINNKSEALNYLYELEEKVSSEGLMYPLNYYE